jgi:hypothetical protein
MDAPPTRTPHLVPSGLGRASRHLPIRGVSRDAARDATARRRDLDIAVATVVGMAAVLSGPLVAVVAVLLLAGTVFATLRLLSEVESPEAEHGVPVESLIVPAVAALGAVGAIRLVPLGPAIIPAIAAVGFLVDRAVALEARLVSASQGPTEEDRSAALVTILVVALVAFAGVAAIVPGGIAGLGLPGAPTSGLPIANLAVLALADAVVAGLLGYRAVALRTPNARAALWAALGYAAVIAIGAAAIRAIGIPRLVGPALLMFLFYLWDTLHAAPPSRRRDPRWLWETAILAGLAIGVIAWNLRVEA